MPKILEILKGRQRRNGGLRRALGLHNRGPVTNIIQFPREAPATAEEYPDYEVISRWLKLADEMLGNTDQPRMDDYDGNTRKKA